MQAFVVDASVVIKWVVAEEGSEEVCERLFANYPLGLQLLHEKTGRTSFEIDAGAVEEPDRHLDGMIKEKYSD